MKASRIKQIIKEEYVNYLLEQKLLENETPDHFGGGENIDVFGYQTEHFDICKSAVMLFTKIKEKNLEGMAVDHAKKAAEHIDKVFGIEKDVVEEGSAAPEQMEEAVDNNMLFGYEIGALSMHIDEDLTRDTAFHKLHIMEIANRYDGSMTEAVNEMKVTNHKGENITKYVLQLLQGKINQKQFEKLTGLKKDKMKSESKTIKGKDAGNFIKMAKAGKKLTMNGKTYTALGKGKWKGPDGGKMNWIQVSSMASALGNKEVIYEAAPGYMHDCASRVIHKEHGAGTCIPEQHNLVKEGKKWVVTEYDVKFDSGKVVRNVPVNELKIVSESHHGHKRRKKKKKNESTASWEKAMRDARRKGIIDKLSKKDKETLLKLADLMKKHGMTKEGVKALKEKLVFYTDKKGRIRRFDDGR